MQTELNPLLTQYFVHSSELARLRAAKSTSLNKLWTVFCPVVEAHQEKILPLFEELDMENEYFRRFGEEGWGPKLIAVTQSDTGYLFQSCDTFRGEPHYSEFTLPAAYVKGNPTEQLERDVAHYSKVLLRLKRWRKSARLKKERVQELAELERLLQKYP